jgi:hypothetical protein
VPRQRRTLLPGKVTTGVASRKRRCRGAFSVLLAQIQRSGPNAADGQAGDALVDLLGDRLRDPFDPGTSQRSAGYT